MHDEGTAASGDEHRSTAASVDSVDPAESASDGGSAAAAVRAMDPPFPCACCGCLVFPEPPGSYAICEVCNWEDDALELEWPTTMVGANSRTLLESQRLFHQDARLGRRPGYTSLPRDPLWRPVDPDRDPFEDARSPDRVRAPNNPVALYYWRPTFWRLNRPAEGREPNRNTEDERVR